MKGTTSVVILAGSLLDEALELVLKGFGIKEVMRGYKNVVELALNYLTKLGKNFDPFSTEGIKILENVITKKC